MQPCDIPEKSAEDGAGPHHQCWEQIFREAVRLNADTAIAEDRCLERVLARIERERSPAAVNLENPPAPQAPETSGIPPARKPAPARAGWFARGLSGAGRHPGLGLALACCVIVAQGVVIAHLWSPPLAPEYAIVRVLPGGEAREPFLRITFLPGTSEQSLRTLLNDIQADVVAGPTRLGDYYLLVPPGQTAAAALALSKSGIVEDVALVDHLPGDD